MKKLILICTGIFCYCATFAQIDSSNTMNHDMNKNQQMDDNKMGNPKMDSHMNQQSQSTQQPMDQSHPDGVIMQGGKMMIVKDGRMSPLDREMTLSNGTKVMSDGTYMNKNGSKMMLKEGQHLDMSGTLVPMKNTQNTPSKTNNNTDNKKMYVVPDSTIKK